MIAITTSNSMSVNPRRLFNFVDNMALPFNPGQRELPKSDFPNPPKPHFSTFLETPSGWKKRSRGSQESTTGRVTRIPPPPVGELLHPHPSLTHTMFLGNASGLTCPDCVAGCSIDFRMPCHFPDSLNAIHATM